MALDARRFRICALLAAGALALALPACGSDDSDGDAAASQADQENAQDAARQKLQQCLRDQGVEMLPMRTRRLGDGEAAPERPSEADMEELREAMEGPCRKYREEAFEASGVDREEMRDAMVKFRACLRDAGVDVDEGPGGGVRMRLDPGDEDARAAMDKCREEMPEGARRGGARIGGGPR